MNIQMTKKTKCKKTVYLGISLIILIPTCIFILRLWADNFQITPFMFAAPSVGLFLTVILVAYLLRRNNPKTLEHTPILAYNECLTCNHDVTYHDSKTKECMYNPHGKLYHSICGCTKFIQKTHDEDKK